LRSMPHGAGRDRGAHAAGAVADDPGSPSVGQGGRGREVGEEVAARATSGVAWIYSACGKCSYCRRGWKICVRSSRRRGGTPMGLRRVHDGGGGFCYDIPAIFSDAEAAPLLCAGRSAYRSLRLTGLKDDSPGLTGFGLRPPGADDGEATLSAVRVYVFSRSEGERAFARELGAVWRGRGGRSAGEPALHHRHDAGVEAGVER